MRYVIGRLKADNVEEAMSVSKILKQALAGFKAYPNAIYKNLSLIFWS